MSRQKIFGSVWYSVERRKEATSKPTEYVIVKIVVNCSLPINLSFVAN